MKLLSICAALAAGEYVASFAPTCGDAWPLAALAALLAVLFGHGLSLRHWDLAAVFLLGIALFLFASAEDEQLYREKPWMRNHVCRRQNAAEPTGVFRSVRRDFSQRIGIGLASDSETASLCRAILLGERNRLPWRTRQLFVESGTMHVFAISGLHVMAIAEVLAFLLGLLFIPTRLRGVAAIPLLWGYVGLIGFPPSAVRAATMATFNFLAPLVWRKPNGIRAWALTFLAVHVFSPQLIVNVGNALSFAVMLAIAFAGEVGRNLPKGRQTLLVTFVAWAAGAPIAAHVFGRVTPGGMLANLVLIGTAKLSVTLGAVGLLASYVSESIAAHLNNAGALLVRAMVLTAEGVTWIPGANFETGSWSLRTCFLWYAGLALLAVWLLARAARRRIL